ncbi:5-methyltetrahydrofolate--homocysteine methyltransferase [Desulfosalsimonas propionicica]|jgi:5-methyltetrahydrofolate--homocysteine methyltransferase|uniref:5-methyltetrahydrofolate--homocysteine methyltransferase n=1 Tax=Desulfosalsimonas propionicica TaxID=332175 RepID=A0A7W0CBT3_9BACT|nr:methyltetrahydrofolate cobalamin methyltransferase [Desulfosalsimonas propionicica]MBA2882866.1 5-methyltetrahydrofolate--homocysteine methyltransferase [Desulfosalsimonas propionicica]
MLIVGELINSSRKAIKEAIDAEDAEAIKKIARDQAECGADYIDVNAGTYVGKEDQYMKWLVSTVQSAVEIPCCIDSPDPKVVEAAMELHKGTPMLNSISLEKERWDALLPVVAGSDIKVIALCMSDSGMPESKDDRLSIASDLINSLVKNNVPVENIYVDPLVQPISTNDSYGMEFMNAVGAIMTEFPGVHTICGLSNISYGLPERKLLNQAFMVMAICKGLDSAIINPLDKRMMANVYAAETLAGRDEFCGNYLTAYREEKLVL